MRFKRITCTAGWTLTSFWGWLFALYFGLRLLVYAQIRYGWPPLSRWLPEWTTSFLFFGLFGIGTLAITVGTLLLCLRGKLPGTRITKLQRQGFPVEPAASENAVPFAFHCNGQVWNSADLITIRPRSQRYGCAIRILATPDFAHVFVSSEEFASDFHEAEDVERAALAERFTLPRFKE